MFKHDRQVSVGGKKRLVRIPIYEIENMGKHMAVDEKQIGEEMHTVLTNRSTGKIALLAKSVNFEELSGVLDAESRENRSVDTLTRDLSSTYKKLGNHSFFNASHIADKFHIIRNMMDAMQSVRVRYRQDVLREKRLAYEIHKQTEKQRRSECQKNNTLYKRLRFVYKDNIAQNGETFLELLARSRYLLYKYPHQWTQTQQWRANALFLKFPQIQKSYQLACDFRYWYKKEHVRKPKCYIQSGLQQWYRDVEMADVDEMLNFKSSVERNQLAITNYFSNGHTNAIAENINGRIQQFISANRGTRDINFFYFKIKKMFAGTSK
ncbi:MAG: transposase [Bacteroidales bacterium]|nr:transposase [Bacteroidales bacterium]